MPVLPDHTDDGPIEGTSLSGVPSKLLRDIDQIAEDHGFTRAEVVRHFLRWAWAGNAPSLDVVKLDKGETENGVTIRVGSKLLREAMARRGDALERNDVILRALSAARDQCVADLAKLRK